MKVLWRQKAINIRTIGLSILIVSGLNVFIVRESGAAPVDDSRMMQLEQEVRSLQRLVDQQTRRIDALENALRQPRVSRGSAPSSAAPVATKSPDTGAWVKSANWDKVRPGMSDADVISVLGPPTTSRNSGQGEAQTLFYAMELEAGGFLSGHVIVVDHRVTEVHKPVLK